MHLHLILNFNYTITAFIRQMPKKPPTAGSFKKGQSGNPKGRPKEYPEIKALARSKTEKAIAALERALDDDKTAVPAAIALLDRGWGRPGQSEPDEHNINAQIIHQMVVDTGIKGR